MLPYASNFDTEKHISPYNDGDTQYQKTNPPETYLTRPALRLYRSWYSHITLCQSEKGV